MRRAGHVLVLVLATVVATLLLRRLGLPSPALFAGLAVGLVDALVAREAVRLPARAGTAGQAVVGVTIGTLVQLSTLSALGEHWLPVLAVTLGTLALSLGTGWLLGRHRDVDAVTGAFALVAGGASGLVAIARQLGADERVVAVVQYVRVLLVVLSLPVVLNLVFGVRAAAEVTAPQDWPVGLVLVVVCGVAGPWLGRRAHLPAHTLLGPLALAALASLSGLTGGSGSRTRCSKSRTRSSACRSACGSPAPAWPRSPGCSRRRSRSSSSGSRAAPRWGWRCPARRGCRPSTRTWPRPPAGCTRCWPRPWGRGRTRRSCCRCRCCGCW